VPAQSDERRLAQLMRLGLAGPRDLTLALLEVLFHLHRAPLLRQRVMDAPVEPGDRLVTELEQSQARLHRRGQRLRPALVGRALEHL
jgi:hypothetical protein